MDLRKLKTIIDLFENSKVSEMEIYEGDDKIKLCKQGESVLHSNRPAETPESAHVASPPPPDPDGRLSPPASGDRPEGKGESGEKLTSPMVGTFYRAASPEADPFVHVGDKVRKGQTVCIIEAMKLMNEIAAPHDGEIAEIAVENGNPVAFGDLLMTIR